MTVSACARASEDFELPPHVISYHGDGRVAKTGHEGGTTTIDVSLPMEARGVYESVVGPLADVGIAGYLDGSLRLRPGRLLAVSPDGERIAVVQDNTVDIVAVHDESERQSYVVDCLADATGVWDLSNTVLGLACGRTLYLLDEDTREVLWKELPGESLDITNWGEDLEY